MELIGKIVIVLVVIFGLLGISAVVFYNKFVALKTKVEKRKAIIDVALKKRFDLIPNLVECVKGYMTHEQETLEKVIKARSMYENASSAQEKEMASGIISSQLRSIFALAENYPDLKANQNFLQLQAELSNIEVQIADTRNLYNEEVRGYNESIEMFPNNIFASIFKFDKFQMFEAEEKERENVKINFTNKE